MFEKKKKKKKVWYVMVIILEYLYYDYGLVFGEVGFCLVCYKCIGVVICVMLRLVW